MSYLKNIAFTSLIKINGRLREFNFRKRTYALYDGDTSDPRGNRYFFKMVKQGDTWTINGEALPDWIKESEGLIIEAIMKQDK